MRPDRNNTTLPAVSTHHLACRLLATCATSTTHAAPQNPTSLGNAWNRSIVYAMGAAIGLESRALWLGGAVEQGPRNHIGLDAWSPNINIARDPRCAIAAAVVAASGWSIAAS